LSSRAKISGALRRQDEKKNSPIEAPSISSSQDVRSKPLNVLLEDYLENLIVKGFAVSTLRVRRVHLQMFLAWCQGVRISFLNQVEQTSLEAYQRYLFDYRKKHGQSLAISSQHSRLAHLKLWFKWMTRRNYLSEDPSSELELPRVGYELPSVLNKEEAERVLRQILRPDNWKVCERGSA
jgi:integrase/recombinase XerD